jgi:WD40 repeat protein
MTTARCVLLAFLVSASSVVAQPLPAIARLGNSRLLEPYPDVVVIEPKGRYLYVASNGHASGSDRLDTCIVTKWDTTTGTGKVVYTQAMFRLSNLSLDKEGNHLVGYGTAFAKIGQSKERDGSRYFGSLAISLDKDAANFDELYKIDKEVNVGAVEKLMSAYTDSHKLTSQQIRMMFRGRQIDRAQIDINLLQEVRVARATKNSYVLLRQDLQIDPAKRPMMLTAYRIDKTEAVWKVLHRTRLFGLTVSPEDKRLYTLCDGPRTATDPTTTDQLGPCLQVNCYDTKTGEVLGIWQYPELLAPVDESDKPGQPLVTLSPDGTRLVVRRASGESFWINATNGKALPGRAEHAVGVFFKPDSKSYFALLGRNLVEFDTATHKPVHDWAAGNRIRLLEQTETPQLRYSGDGKELIVSTRTQTETWTVSKPEAAPKLDINRDTDWVRENVLAASPKWNVLDGLGRSVLVQSGNNKPRELANAFAPATANYVISPDERLLAAQHHPTGDVRVWTLAEPGTAPRSIPAPKERLDGAITPTPHLAISQDSRFVLLVVESNSRRGVHKLKNWTADVVRIDTNEVVHQASGVGLVKSARFLKTGDLALVVTSPTAAEIKTLPDVRYSTNDELIVVHPANRIVTRITVGDRITATAFSPDDRMVALGTYGLIQLVELQTTGVRERFALEKQSVASLAFRPDGKHLASDLGNGELLVWDVGPQKGRVPTQESGWLAVVQDLRSSDATKAYASMRQLQANPVEGVNAIRLWIKDHPAAKPQAVHPVLEQLKSSKFSERETAFGKLRNFGYSIRPQLQKALAEAEEVDQIVRLKGLLREPHIEEWTTASRIIEVLGWMNTNESTLLLKELGDGSADAPLTMLAKGPHKP